MTAQRDPAGLEENEPWIVVDWWLRREPSPYRIEQYNILEWCASWHPLTNPNSVNGWQYWPKFRDGIPGQHRYWATGVQLVRHITEDIMKLHPRRRNHLFNPRIIVPGFSDES